jgi:hypothetical protein
MILKQPVIETFLSFNLIHFIIYDQPLHSKFLSHHTTDLFYFAKYLNLSLGIVCM